MFPKKSGMFIPDYTVYICIYIYTHICMCIYSGIDVICTIIGFWITCRYLVHGSPTSTELLGTPVIQSEVP